MGSCCQLRCVCSWYSYVGFIHMLGDIQMNISGKVCFYTFGFKGLLVLLSAGRLFDKLYSWYVPNLVRWGVDQRGKPYRVGVNVTKIEWNRQTVDVCEGRHWLPSTKCSDFPTWIVNGQWRQPLLSIFLLFSSLNKSCFFSPILVKLKQFCLQSCSASEKHLRRINTVSVKITQKWRVQW